MAARDAGAAALQSLLERLRESLRRLFAQRREAQAGHRSQLQRQLLLGLDLLWKIEEQVVLPALHDAPADVPRTAVRPALDELELMRDQALLATQTSSHKREATLAVLEGMTMLHFARVAQLLDEAPAQAADWPALEHAVRGLLGRWRGEVQAHGDVEDEDRDPVGLPPS